MKLIELHWDSKPFSLNVNYIAAVNAREGLCEIFMIGDQLGQQWTCEESYEEVLQMIREANGE